MLVFGIHYLMERAYATAFNDYERSEWPPHFQRLFSALVATHHENDDPPQEERDVLQFLEALEPPKISASAVAAMPEPPTHFVPVNDKLVYTGGKRLCMPRTFPSVTPETPYVFFVWDVDLPPEMRECLKQLVKRLSRLGHSASAVRAELLDTLPEWAGAPNWIPDPNGTHELRVTEPGQLEKLEAYYEQHKGNITGRVMPYRLQKYRCTDQEVATVPDPVGGVFSPASEDWVILKSVSGKHHPAVSLSGATRITSKIRSLLIKFAQEVCDTVPEMITGHTHAPHLAIVPLGNVGHKYADSSVKGIALVLPRQMTSHDRSIFFRSIGQWEKSAQKLARDRDREIPEVPVFVGQQTFYFERLTLASGSPLKTLQSLRWVRPSRTWQSVTPVALDRNPGSLSDPDPRIARKAWDSAKATVTKACAHVGLPKPSFVSVDFVSQVAGAGRAKTHGPFPVEQRKGKPRRVLIHATLRFDVAVEGPLLLGAGRYLGLGLFLPVGDASCH